MFLQRLHLRNFRSYRELDVSFDPGLNVITGENGAGKTNVLEAISYLARTRSFRGAPTEAMVRLGEDRAIVRADAVVRDRQLLIETEIVPAGRSRMLVNKQAVRSASDRNEMLAITVFAPDDLVLVKGGPGERRDFVDDVLSIAHRRNDALLKDLDRVLRQRNALLKQCGGRLSGDIAFTLDVWDDKLNVVGEDVVRVRMALLNELAPFVQRAYDDIADRPSRITMTYRCSFTPGSLATALQAGRNDDVRRGLSLVGPHRDDIELLIDGRPSRTHASQGEQRTLALALKLGGHRLLGETLEAVPILLLDDVFSELDPLRSDALVRHLPAGQVVLATAGIIPPSIRAEVTSQVSRDEDGSVLVSSTNPSLQAPQTVDNSVDSVDEVGPVRVKDTQTSPEYRGV